MSIEGQRPRRSDDPYISTGKPIEREEPILEDRLSTSEKVFDFFKDKPLTEFSAVIAGRNVEFSAVEDPQHIIDAAYVEARNLYGDDFAKKLEASMAKSQMLPTGPHVGLVTDAIETQGLPLVANVYPGEVMPVMYTNTVPIGNSSVGKGGPVLARTEPTGERDKHGQLVLKDGQPIRRPLSISLFPREYHDVLVGAAPNITREMLRSGKQRADKLFHAGRITQKEYEGVQSLFASCTDEMLELPTFEDLVAVWNRNLWKGKILAPDLAEKLPDIAYLSIERTLTRAIIFDIKQSPQSFISQALFNPTLRNAILEELDGLYGCWDTKKLALMADKDVPKQAVPNAGSQFFEEVDSEGRGVPLRVVEYHGQPYLERVKGPKSFPIPLTEAGIVEGLESGRLNPKLWLPYTYAQIHGFFLVGGSKQSHYLSDMRRGNVRAFRKAGYEDWAVKTGRVPTRPYVTTITYAMAQYADGQIEPAGAVEFIANGGLTLDEFRRGMQTPYQLAGTFWKMSNAQRRAALLGERDPQYTSFPKLDVPIIDLSK